MTCITNLYRVMHFYGRVEPHNAHIFEKVCNTNHTFLDRVALHSKVLMQRCVISSRAKLVMYFIFKNMPARRKCDAC